MNVMSFPVLSKGYESYGPQYSEWEVSSNPFVMERTRYGVRIDYIETRPNWALIIPLAIALLVAIITVSVLLYRHWRKKNCHPVYFAGKVTYLRKGALLHDAADFIADQTANLKDKGHVVDGIYTDPALTTPLDKGTVVTAPVYLYPKLK